MIAWLQDQAGLRVPITSAGILIGRDPHCHVIVDDPTVSRRHVLLLLTREGVQVMAMGRGTVTVDGAAVSEPTMASDGSVVALGDSRFELVVQPDASQDPPWVLEHEGRSYRLRPGAFRLGGGEGDDLRIPGWPDGALTLSEVEGGLVLETREPLTLAGRPVPPGMHSLRPGDTIRLGEARLKLVARGGSPASTLGASATSALPSAVDLEFVPNGGVLQVTTSRCTTVWLPEKRCDLCAALLDPPGDHRAGDFVPDDLLIPRVWGAAGANRMQLNTLVHRVRKSLTAAGLNGARLVERARGGGATRFVVRDGAAIAVH